jgi:predicted ATP-dependent endonuclease of OLD family
LIDEPGNNLHPGAQIEILKFLHQLSKNNQIFYTTHMPFLVDPTKPESIINLIEDPNDIKSVIKSENIEIVTEMINTLGIPSSYYFFSFQNYIFVEGPSDRVLYIHLLELFKENYDILVDLFPEQIISLDSADNAKHIAITYEQLNKNNFMVILDSDQKGLEIADTFLERKKSFNFKDRLILLKMKNCAIEDYIPKNLIEESLDELGKKEIFEEKRKQMENSNENMKNSIQSKIISKMDKKGIISKVKLMKKVTEKMGLFSKYL